MIDERSTLTDVAFAVCTKLHESGLEVVLVGGSAATFYAPAAYQSGDADFVALFSPTEDRSRRLVASMRELGYEIDGNLFKHMHGSPFIVEFPKGPLGVGGDLIRTYETIKRDSQVLNVVSPTDCVRDRLSAYYFWDDQSSLYVAVDVALAVADKIDLRLIQQWSARENETRKHDDFVRLLRSKQSAQR